MQMVIYIELWTIAAKYDWIHAEQWWLFVNYGVLGAYFIDGTFIREAANKGPCETSAIMYSGY